MEFIGIDPGKKGGVAIITEDGDVARLHVYSEESFRESIAAYKGRQVRAALEKVHAMPGQGVKSMFTFGEGYGYIRGVLEAAGIRYQLVDPKTWQKEFGVHTKDNSIAAAKKLFPEANLKPTQRAVKDSDGMADALLIAEWARRRLR